VTAPTFSVVIPAYNAQGTVASTISSVFGQTFADFELIVVDDGSQDRTPEIVRTFGDDSRMRLIEQPNQGTAGARNTGARAAAGSYVSFLDNDDVWMPTYLEAMDAALREASRPGFAYADGWLLDAASGRVNRRSALQITGAPLPPPAAPREFLRRLVEVTFIRSATTIPRSVLAEVGGFDPALSGVDDFDLWIRILAAGYRGVQVPGMLLVYRDRPDSLSKDGLRMVTARRKVLRRVVGSYEMPPEVTESASGQLPALDTLEAALTGASPARASLLRGRLLLGKLRRAVLRPLRLRRKPPAELIAALGDPGEL
jgi:glycosyltransferase involved in cell wall biosynthesis